MESESLTALFVRDAPRLAGFLNNEIAPSRAQRLSSSSSEAIRR